MSLIQRVGATVTLTVLVATPLFASAQTTDIQAQIDALLAQIRALQAQLAISSAESGSSATPPPPPSTSCVNLTTNMHVRSTDAATGGQVTLLQNYLIANGYMTGPATGYYGRGTTHAVGQLQLSLGITTSVADPNYGYVGPRTRGAIACSGRGALSAIPASGRAPLSVMFSGSLSGTSYFGGVKLDPGTGSEAQSVCDPAASCTSFKIGYTYQNTGTYTAQLLGIGEGSTKVLGAATIVVTSASTTAPSAIIDPRSLVSTTQNPTIYGTASNTYNSAVDFLVGSGGSVIYESGSLAVVNGKWSGTVSKSLAPGSYLIKVHDAHEAGYTTLTEGTLTVSSGNPNNITVTAPNGGEQWRIGELNTITWQPYGYNPDINPSYNVTAYLEEKSGDTYTTVGRIMDSGKASIHTYFNINDYNTWATPGQYYVRVVNNVTGATDRSDAPFTLLAKAVDLKVDGSDGPVTLTDNQQIKVSWSTGRSEFTSCTLQGVREQVGTGFPAPITNLPTSGERIMYAYIAPNTSSSVLMSCANGDSSIAGYDNVQVNAAGSTTSASIKITTPNGGEQWDINSTYGIRWTNSGVNSVSIALYQNDQWMAWLQKDLPILTGSSSPCYGGPLCTYSWKPSTVTGVNDLLGKTVAKIYITGKKNDGTGYVDDKSDAPFTLVSSSGSSDVKITADPLTVPAGGRATVSWSAPLGSSCIYSSATKSPSDLAYGTYGATGATGVGPLLKNATYTITCNGVSSNVTVFVEQSAPTITVTPAVVAVGGRATVSWYASAGSSCVYSSPTNSPTDGPYGTYGATGAIGVGPLMADATYMITCNGQSSSAKVTVVTSTNPTAYLTVNGKNEITVKPGDSILYEWGSTSALSASSSYVADTPDTCPNSAANSFVLPVTTRSGSFTTTAVAYCRAGHTYTVTYKVAGTNNQTTSASVIVHVSPNSSVANLSASPNPCTIPSGASTCTSTISWYVPSGITAQVWANGAGETPALFNCTIGPANMSKDATWITSAGATFNLYQTASCNTSAITGKTPISTLTVSGVPAATSMTGQNAQLAAVAASLQALLQQIANMMGR